MLTISAIKADVGSIGGHTRPSTRMLETVRERLGEAAGDGRILDLDGTGTLPSRSHSAEAAVRRAQVGSSESAPSGHCFTQAPQPKHAP